MKPEKLHISASNNCIVIIIRDGPNYTGKRFRGGKHSIVCGTFPTALEAEKHVEFNNRLNGYDIPEKPSNDEQSSRTWEPGTVYFNNESWWAVLPEGTSGPWNNHSAAEAASESNFELAVQRNIT